MDFFLGCFERYVRNWCLGRLEQRHLVRDWFLKRAFKSSVDSNWVTVNQSTVLLTNSNLEVLIFMLKKAEAVSSFGPIHMDDDIPAVASHHT